MTSYTYSNVNEQTSYRNAFLEIDNVTKSYTNAEGKESIILDGVSLNVSENEYISVIGHSGCGKSTLLKIVAGLEKSTSGSVRLDGKEIRKPGAERMMVFQHYGLLSFEKYYQSRKNKSCQ
jgi:nitrate/nitrite transport system ATP-binding protein